MDNTPLFPLEQYEAGFPDLPQAENDDTDAALQERDQTDETPDTEELRQATEPASPTVFGQEDVPARDMLDHRAGIGEEQKPGGTGEHAGVEETPSIYESTGLAGPFPLSPMASIFPEARAEIPSLAATIETLGLLEEPTVAGDPLMVVDGKRRLVACKVAGVQPTFRLLRRDINPRAYLWAKNGERRDLTSSQKALAFAELFPSSGPGRPPGRGKNCAISDNFPQPTQGQGASTLSISRGLIIDAEKVANPNGTVVPEVREAVREAIVTVSDVVQDKVRCALPEVQRTALSMVTDGKAKTMAEAVARVVQEVPQYEVPQYTGKWLSTFDPPTRIGQNATFYCCSMTQLRMQSKPGTVDLILACPPDGARLVEFSKLGALATHALAESGVMVVAVVASGDLLKRLDRLTRDGPEFIAEFSILFPVPIAELGHPHYTEIRRGALLVFGKSAAHLPPGDDVIEVPAPGSDTADHPMELEDGMSLVVSRFASQGQVVCIPTLQGNSSAVLGALGSGCTVVGVDEYQSIIDDVVREVSASAG